MNMLWSYPHIALTNCFTLLVPCRISVFARRFSFRFAKTACSHRREVVTRTELDITYIDKTLRSAPAAAGGRRGARGAGFGDKRSSDRVMTLKIRSRSRYLHVSALRMLLPPSTSTNILQEWLPRPPPPRIFTPVSPVVVSDINDPASRAMSIMCSLSYN